MTAEQFCLDFLRDIVALKDKPLERQAMALGYARTLEAMLDTAKAEAGNKS